MNMLQLTPEKQKGSQEITMNNHMAIKWTNQKKWINFQK